MRLVVSNPPELVEAARAFHEELRAYSAERHQAEWAQYDPIQAEADERGRFAAFAIMLVGIGFVLGFFACLTSQIILLHLKEWF